MKLSNGEVFVSRILKIEPEGVTFKKPVTVLLSHSLDEDQDLMYFYELIVVNFSPTGYQELKTEPISSIEGTPILNIKVIKKNDSHNFQSKTTLLDTWFVLLYTNERSFSLICMQQKIMA